MWLCDPVDCSPSVFRVHGILQARVLEGAAISSFRGSSWPRDWSRASCWGRWILYPKHPLGSRSSELCSWLNRFGTEWLQARPLTAYSGPCVPWTCAGHSLHDHELTLHSLLIRGKPRQRMRNKCISHRSSAQSPHHPGGSPLGE